MLADLMALPNPSIMRIKGKGEREYPCLRPLEGLKVLDGEPLSNIEKLVVVTRAIIHIIQLYLKPYAISTSLMYD